MTGTAGAAPIKGTTIVAVKATGEDAGDNAGYDAVNSATLVNVPTTTITITTKDRKTKGFLDRTDFPVLQDGSFAISFCHDGINKLVIKPTHPPGFGCLHCGKEFKSFGNIAHHIGTTYPRMIDSTNGSKGELSKIDNVHTGTCADVGDLATINMKAKQAEWESKNTPNTPLCTVTMEELRVLVFKHNNIADDSKPPAISQEGKTKVI